MFKFIFRERKSTWGLYRVWNNEGKLNLKSPLTCTEISLFLVVHIASRESNFF